MKNLVFYRKFTTTLLTSTSSTASTKKPRLSRFMTWREKPVPCASLTLLMLGPGTTITHAAIRVLADNGCLVAWTGEEGARMYAFGQGETRYTRNVLRQAWLVSHRAPQLGGIKERSEQF